MNLYKFQIWKIFTRENLLKNNTLSNNNLIYLIKISF
jgi:hypothetical protein